MLAQQPRWTDPEFEGSGFTGVSAGEDFQFATQVSGSPTEAMRTVSVHYGSGYQLGARVNQNLNDYWNADLEYSFANQPLRFTNLSPSVPTLSFGQTVHHFSYSISYIPLGGSERFRPYAKIGTGATLFYIHGDSRDYAETLGVHVRDSWKLSVNWGGGFKYILSDQALLSFDVKDYLAGVPSYGIPHSAQVIDGQFQAGCATAGVLQNFQLNIGIAYRWNYWTYLLTGRAKGRLR